MIVCRVSWQPRQREREREREREKEGKKERGGGAERERESSEPREQAKEQRASIVLISYTHQRRAIRMWSTPLFRMI